MNEPVAVLETDILVCDDSVIDRSYNKSSIRSYKAKSTPFTNAAIYRIEMLNIRCIYFYREYSKKCVTG